MSNNRAPSDTGRIDRNYLPQAPGSADYAPCRLRTTDGSIHRLGWASTAEEALARAKACMPKHDFEGWGVLFMYDYLSGDGNQWLVCYAPPFTSELTAQELMTQLKWTPRWNTPLTTALSGD